MCRFLPAASRIRGSIHGYHRAGRGALHAPGSKSQAACQVEPRIGSGYSARAPRAPIAPAKRSNRGREAHMMGRARRRTRLVTAARANRPSVPSKIDILDLIAPQHSQQVVMERAQPRTTFMRLDMNAFDIPVGACLNQIWQNQILRPLYIHF